MRKEKPTNFAIQGKRSYGSRETGLHDQSHATNRVHQTAPVHRGGSPIPPSSVYVKSALPA